MARKISELPIVEIRESIFDLDELLCKLSGINKPYTNDITEAILCLGNEIKRLKDEKNLNRNLL